jgi:hypothetical protein
MAIRLLRPDTKRPWRVRKADVSRLERVCLQNFHQFVRQRSRFRARVASTFKFISLSARWLIGLRHGRKSLPFLELKPQQRLDQGDLVLLPYFQVSCKVG